jgi:hypothetical protein
MRTRHLCYVSPDGASASRPFPENSGAVWVQHEHWLRMDFIRSRWSYIKQIQSLANS